MSKSYSKEQFFKDLNNYKPDSAPGSRYSYSNVGVEILGYILETINRKTISELIHENFIETYGMKYTKLELNEEDEKHLSSGYWMKNSTTSPNFVTPLWGTSGFLYSTLPDMLCFIELQFDAHNEVIKESHNQLLKKGRDRFAYMWRIIDDPDGYTVYLHHGQTHSMQNWIYFNQHSNFGLYIVTNQSGFRTGGYLIKLSETSVSKDKKGT
nr:serine hydrolase domain-containing protein [Snuella sedimenti]